MAVREKAVVTDADEALGQDVHSVYAALEGPSPWMVTEAS